MEIKCILSVVFIKHTLPSRILEILADYNQPEDFDKVRLCIS